MKLKEKETLKTKKTEENENQSKSKQSSSGSSKKRKENKCQEIKPGSRIEVHEEEEAQDLFADVVFPVESEDSNIEESILDPETGMILENNNQKKPYMAEDIHDEVFS